MSNPILPDWTRWSWASTTERAWWAPLMRDISNAFIELELLSVVEGIRRAAWQFVAPHELPEKTRWAHQHGLLLIPIEHTNVSTTSYSSGGPNPYAPGGVASYRCVYVRPEHYDKILPFRDDEKIGEYLGYPECCRQSFHATWGRGQVDSTWEQLQATDWSQPTLASTLWRWLGVRLVPHLPCSYSCKPSNVIAEQFFNLGMSVGYVQEMRAAVEILKWPVRYSRLFGIAEIVSPAVKISTRTDWTPSIERASKPGTYTPPATTLWTDNGFSEPETMRRVHRMLTNAILPYLNDVTRLMDLGCGNGQLLREIRQHRPHLVIGGIDTNADAIGRACGGLPNPSRWITGTIESLEWTRFRPDAVLFMPGRLKEMSPDEAQKVRDHLATISTVFLYTYGDWNAETLPALCADVGLPSVRLLHRTPELQVGVVQRS